MFCICEWLVLAVSFVHQNLNDLFTLTHFVNTDLFMKFAKKCHKN